MRRTRVKNSRNLLEVVKLIFWGLVVNFIYDLLKIALPALIEGLLYNRASEIATDTLFYFV